MTKHDEIKALLEEIRDRLPEPRKDETALDAATRWTPQSTLGDLADELRAMKKGGMTRASVLYALDRVYVEDEPDPTREHWLTSTPEEREHAASERTAAPGEALAMDLYHASLAIPPAAKIGPTAWDDATRRKWLDVARAAREHLSADARTPQPDPGAVTLRREGLTKPTVLRLAASDLRRNYYLGINGLPKSLPDTLDALADAMEADQ